MPKIVTLKNKVLIVRMSSREIFIAEKDGWNPNEEIVVYGPFPPTLRGSTFWVVKTNDIIAYRQLIEAERAWIMQEGNQFWGYLPSGQGVRLHQWVYDQEKEKENV